MAISLEVGLGPGHNVPAGDPAPLPKKGDRAPNFRPIFSERELTFTFAICCHPSVCLSSVCLSPVTLVHRTRAVEIFGNISMVFGFGTLAIR